MKTALAVVGLGLGDEGKGVTVDRLAASLKPDLVVRFNGGYQAAHHVQPSAGAAVHCFSQFCSGTLAGVKGHLSRYVAVEPVAMRNEATSLHLNCGLVNPYEMLTVDPFALVVTPYHRWMNQQEEMDRGDDRHGSCGLGIWEAVSHQRAHPDEAIQICHLKSGLVNLVMDRLERIHTRLSKERGLCYPRSSTRIDRAWAQHWIDCAVPIHIDMDERVLDAADSVIFEGAQGVLLDENYGFHPHTSASTTTFVNAEKLNVDYYGCKEFRRIGVVRSHMTRHGAGPLPTEDPTWPLPMGEQNAASEWQGAFRIGAFDEVLLRYALDVCGGVDELVVTHTDYPQIQMVDDPCTLGIPKGIQEQERLTEFVSSLAKARHVRRVVSPGQLLSHLSRYAPIRMSGHGPARENWSS